MALGIGGWRLLRALGLSPQVCHMNEGHAAFAALERARDFMGDGHPFSVARAATRAGNLFTTHTPVESGFDRFSESLVDACLGAYLRDEVGITTDELLTLGSAPNDSRGVLNMAWLATRLSGAVNAVSLRHEEVSRRTFRVLFDRWPEADLPVGHVTNGVHVPSWDSAEADTLWTRACGSDRWAGATDRTGEKIKECSDAELWAFRCSARARLIPFVRERLSRQLASAGVSGERLDAAARVLDGDVLTIGMARRFTAYKRPTLLLHDEERFARVLQDPRRPLQIVVAGKAHPRDDEGKAFVQDWVRFARRLDVRHSVVFLADYDLRLAEHLVEGVDLWLNTPRPPWEACGTSGMKVLVNGGLNLSARDGWWAEAYQPEVGWVLEGDGNDDEADASRLYELIEREVLTAYYDRDAQGIPRGWTARMRASMSRLTPQYSANRAVREYTRRYYAPAAASCAARTANGAAGAIRIYDWGLRLRAHWQEIRFEHIQVESASGHHRVEVALRLGDVDPDDVCVELYADAEGGGGAPERAEMSRQTALVGGRGFLYSCTVPDTRPAAHFTPRVVPRKLGVAVPLEASMITWAH
jgi:starch phosphorylase